MSRDLTEDNNALSHNYGQDTAIYCRTTSIGCLANQATSVKTGASPQDVRHLFTCTTHPTDLSPEDLWRWDQFVHLAISTTETLTDLKTDLFVANNDNKDIKKHLNVQIIPTTCGGIDSSVKDMKIGVIPFPSIGLGQIFFIHSKTQNLSLQYRNAFYFFAGYSKWKLD